MSIWVICSSTDSHFSQFVTRLSSNIFKLTNQIFLLVIANHYSISDIHVDMLVYDVEK